VATATLSGRPRGRRLACMAPRRRRVRAGFVLFAVLAILSLLVLDGAVSGIAALAAMLVFIAACISALRGQDAATSAQSDRTGLAGWIGGWF
jgi:type II secretory pathway component PulM